MQVKQQTTAIVDGKTTSQKVSVLIEENNNGNSLCQAGVNHILKSSPACQDSCLFTIISTLQEGGSKT